MVIAIAGTSGSGKSSVAKIIADRTGFELLNTGRIYRKITKECLRQGISPDDLQGVSTIAKEIHVESLTDDDLHAEAISLSVPQYAKIESVRVEVRRIQRSLGKKSNVVVEGRDIGTVVFPQARLKFFITATLEERARRRQKQLGQSGSDSLGHIMKNLEERDRQDEHRPNSPLEVAVDAQVVDTTEMSLEEVVGILMRRIEDEFL